MRKALGQCGENATAVLDPGALAQALGLGSKSWVQVTLFQHAPVVRRGFAIRAMTYQDPRSLAPAPIPHFSGLHIVMGCPWHDIRIVTDAGSHWRNISSELPAPGEQMGEVIQFIPKPAPDRAARLIQEARAIYESIFPTETASIAPIEDDDTSA